jgi:arabinogalactan endo-1,4-beta-galactosidase
MLFSRVLSALGFVATVSALVYRGADISSLIIVEQEGVTFKDVDGAPAKFEYIASEHGMNAARVRVWTSGQYNLSYALAMGKASAFLSPLTPLSA